MSVLKKLVWLGNTRSALKQMPTEVQDEIGYGLYQAQCGCFPQGAKRLKGFNGVIEIINNSDRNTYIPIAPQDANLCIPSCGELKEIIL